MIANQQLALVPLVELEQLAQDKQREYQSLYMPAIFEGVAVQRSRSFNTPGLEVKRYRVSKHNFGALRNDVWFDFGGFEWHGYQIGERSQICHCQQTKREARS